MSSGDALVISFTNEDDVGPYAQKVIENDHKPVFSINSGLDYYAKCVQ